MTIEKYVGMVGLSLLSMSTLGGCSYFNEDKAKSLMTGDQVTVYNPSRNSVIFTGSETFVDIDSDGEVDLYCVSYFDTGIKDTSSCYVSKRFTSEPGPFIVDLGFQDKGIYVGSDVRDLSTRGDYPQRMFTMYSEGEKIHKEMKAKRN
ncbi:hypothetical protein HOC01_02955 [archaeon]|jgi:hypothetical protein|nr:hypothetical protein [archaeon]MBT6698150.1 hypothetical protein [archaeon]